MIGLSVAVGRFVEALFGALLHVAGGIAAVVVLGVLALVVLWVLGRRMWRRRGSR